ncbi:hypothetical protein Sjap_013651 [Stephania japonica]|uniref:RING-type E3 ubiquitin transferase n=1 Tax=Stephania japonica TaxID=461633 RepID=A0AAP0IYD8_9MAGN
MYMCVPKYPLILTPCYHLLALQPIHNTPFMETLPPQVPQSSHILFTPLIISMVGIACTALVLVFYQFVLSRCCNHTNSAVPQLNQQIGETGNELHKKKLVESIPIVTYSKSKDGQFRVDHNECAVCLGELEEEEMVRLMPSCRHAFHAACIDQWFSSRSNCPVCRSPIVEEQRMEVRGDEEEDRVHVSTDSTTSLVDTSLVVCDVQEEIVLPNSVSIKIEREGNEDCLCSSSSSASSNAEDSVLDSKSGKGGVFGSSIVKSFSRLSHVWVSNGALPR